MATAWQWRESSGAHREHVHRRRGNDDVAMTTWQKQHGNDDMAMTTCEDVKIGTPVEHTGALQTRAQTQVR